MKTKVAAALAGAVLLVALGVATTFWSFSQMKEAAEARKHTLNVIVSAEIFLSQLEDAETGARVFLLTDDETFLQPYMAVRDNIRSNLEKLYQLVHVSAARQHLEALSPLVDAKLAELSQAIELRRKHDITAALAIVSKGQNTHLMDTIRDEIRSFVQLEQDALAVHEVEFQSNSQILYTLIVGFSLAALLSAIAFVYFIYRQIQQRVVNLAHVQTVHLLESQKELNEQLHLSNIAIQESEERFRTLADNISQLVWMSDAQGSLFWYNQRWFDYTGTTLEEMHGWGWQKVHHPDHEQRVVESFKHSLETGAVWEDTFPLRGTDGQYRWFLSRAMPVRDEHGIVLRWFGTNTDITERKQAEEAFRDLDQKLASTMGLSQLFDWEYDVASGLFTFSDKYYSLHGTTSELEGGNLMSAVDFGRKFVHPDDVHLLGEEIAKAVETTDPNYLVKTEARILRLDGEVRYVWVVFSVIKSVEGQTIKLHGVNQDITDRKLMEMDRDRLSDNIKSSDVQKLASQYARSLIEASLDPFVTINAEGKITDVNEASVQATGVLREQLIGTDFSDYFTDPSMAREGYQKVFSEGLVRNYPLAIRHVSGSIMDVLYNASVYKDDKGNVLGVFAAARDVTQQKLLDQQLRGKNTELERAKIAAETANLAKSEFLSHMSHELRTPLNAILGFAQLLETSEPSLTRIQLVRLNQILKAGWYLLDLISEILDLALIESGKSSMSLEPVSLAKVLLECQAMFVPQAADSSIHLHFHMFDSSWFVHADQTKLKQVLTNLLSNAIKYNCEQGTVEVNCSETTSGRLRISVKDSGPGLSSEKLPQLFQPFSRLGQEVGIKEGTGIGLAVSKKLVEMMGGTIGVESTVGVGSEFWFELDRDVESQPIAASELNAEFNFQPKEDAAHYTLLYVEDNPANLMLVEQIIGDRPHIRMLSARDGTRGIALAQEQLPDVILMDINLPGISGIEAMILLRKDPATKHIPIIALSANAMVRDIDQGLEAGFFRYLTKPIKISEFTEALNAAMASVGSEQSST